MAGYAGYSGYGDPARTKVDRARQMAELLQQGATDTSPKSFWEGAAQLGKAFIARDAMGKAETAETSYAKNQERLLRHFMDPNTDEFGFSPSQMQPTINVGTEPETVVNWKDQPPAAATPASASPMPEPDKMRALANVLGGVYEGDGRTADIGAKQVSLPPMPTPQTGNEKRAEVLRQQGVTNPGLDMQEYTRPVQPVQPGAPAATPAASQTQSSVSPGVAAITATLAPQTQAGVPPMAPAATPMAAPTMAAPPATAQAPQSFRPPPPAAPNRQAALMTAMRMTGGNLQEAMSLVEAKYGAAPQGMSAYEAEMIRLKELEMNAPAKPTNLPEGMWNGPDGKGPPQPIPGYVDMRAQIAAAGRAPSGSNGITPYQGLQTQLRLDEIDREIETNAQRNRSSLTTLDNSIALLDKFMGDTEKFNAVYGNTMNPTGKKDDLFNWSIGMDDNRKDGMAMLNQLGGQAFIDSIRDMKSAGGAGSVSDSEGAKLATAATRLMEVNQTDAAAKEAADEFKLRLSTFRNALAQDMAKKETAEKLRRQQVEEMMGGNSGSPVQSSQPTEDDDTFIDKLFGGIGNLFSGGGAQQQRNALPPGVTPEMWSVMDDEDKAAFQR